MAGFTVIIIYLILNVGIVFRRHNLTLTSEDGPRAEWVYIHCALCIHYVYPEKTARRLQGELGATWWITMIGTMVSRSPVANQTKNVQLCLTTVTHSLDPVKLLTLAWFASEIIQLLAHWSWVYISIPQPFFDFLIKRVIDHELAGQEFQIIFVHCVVRTATAMYAHSV